MKAYVFFRGREIVFKVQGEILLLRFANELEEWGKAEQLPTLEGKKMLMLIGPRKNKSDNQTIIKKQYHRYCFFIYP